MSAHIDLIDLKPYIHSPQRALIVELYALHGWDFQSGTGWQWTFADVCALYFRCQRHSHVFGIEGVEVLKEIVSAINDYLQDEFS